MSADRARPPVSFALRLVENRYALFMSIAVILMAGLSALTNLPRIEDPRITNRYPRVTTFLPGASADRVEALVTEKLEDRLNEISEIKRIESTSRNGISVLALELQDDITSATNEEVFSRIRDKLGDATADLPDEASKPFFDDKFAAVAFTVIASVEWQRDDAPQLGVLKRLSEDLADRLRDLAGTDIVRLYGAPDEEIGVAVNADSLAALGLTAQSLVGLIAGADPKLPAGALRAPARDLFMEVSGELDSASRVASVPLLSSGGAVVRLGDIATVTKGLRDPPDDITYTDGARSVLVAARTLDDVRVDQWAAAARAAIDDFAANSAPGVTVSLAFDQSAYTEQRLSSLGGNLFAGVIVVMLVVFLGMGWRAALIVGMALPLSGSLALFGLSFFDQQIHQMTIFGMIIAIGLLIDNAIVMTDDIKQRLDEGRDTIAAVTSAVSHLFVPLLASTLTTILGFMPVFLLPGAMGDFVGPVAISVVLALVASFAVSMTLIPALGGLFLRRRRDLVSYHWWNNGLRFARLSRAYRTTLRHAVARPWLTVPLCFILPLTGFVLAGTLGKEFFPPADRDQFEIKVWLPSDAAIGRTARLAHEIEQDVVARDGVRHVNWRIGGSFPIIYYNRVMREQNNSAFAHAMVYTDSVTSAKRLTATLESELSDRFPEAQIIVAPFAQGPPVDSPVGFRLGGPDVTTLRTLGDEIRRIMHTVPGITKTRASVTAGEPKLSLAADRDVTRVAGLSLTDVAGQMQTSLEGALGGSVLEDLESLPVRIRIMHGQRDSMSAVTAGRIVAPNGEWLPLDALGEITIQPEAAAISRWNGVRVNNIEGYALPGALAIDVTAAVWAKLNEAGFELPPGYTLVDAGDSAEQKTALGKLFIYLPILGMLMATTLILSFRSVSLALQIGVVAFLSVGLGMFALWTGGYALGFNAIIGSAGLIGVAINGTIVVLAAIRGNPRAARGDVDAIVAETTGATRHIVSTTLTTIGGFAPLLLFSGGDFWPPLAVVIAGGVGFSVILSLFFTPAAYCLIEKISARLRPRAPAPAELPA